MVGLMSMAVTENACDPVEVAQKHCSLLDVQRIKSDVRAGIHDMYVRERTSASSTDVHGLQLRMVFEYCQRLVDAVAGYALRTQVCSSLDQEFLLPNPTLLIPFLLLDAPNRGRHEAVAGTHTLDSRLLL